MTRTVISMFAYFFQRRNRLMRTSVNFIMHVFEGRIFVCMQLCMLLIY